MKLVAGHAVAPTETDALVMAVLRLFQSFTDDGIHKVDELPFSPLVGAALHELADAVRPLVDCKNTDNPADPCCICVQWAAVVSTDGEIGEVNVPIMPDRPVRRMWTGMHDDCADAIAAHLSQEAGS